MAARPDVKALRSNPTDAERVLWQRLRAKRATPLPVRRQWPVGPYIVDFVCLRARLIIEVDGGQHGGVRDDTRTAWLNAQGFQVLRFWNNEVLTNTDGVVERIVETIGDAVRAKGVTK